MNDKRIAMIPWLLGFAFWIVILILDGDCNLRYIGLMSMYLGLLLTYTITRFIDN